MIALGQIYPGQVRHRILLDARILTLLKNNAVTTAEQLLTTDLDSNVSSLSTLGQVVELSGDDQAALKDPLTHG